jgi:multicomponent Na+:H+ antiporter subunit E
VKRITSHLALAVWLVILWVVLWGQFTPANLLGGIAIALVVLTALPVGEPARLADGSRAVRFNPIAAIGFIGWLFWQVVVSSLKLAWEVVTPRNSIAMGVVEVRLRGISEVHTLVVANCITLTPGTLTIEATTDPTVLDVHVLHLVDPEAVRQDVLALEARVVRAFGSPAARALLDADDTGEVGAAGGVDSQGESS